ncbi:MAG: cell division protein ZapA [Firmicutes bacterium]|nr:cell division protein ZapA [Bacillota bacterium]
MNRISVNLFGREYNLRAPEEPEVVLKAAEEVRRRGEGLASQHRNRMSREELFMLIALNLAQELLALKAANPNNSELIQATPDESR